MSVPLRQRVWWTPQGAAAAGIVLVMVVWRAVLMADSFFNQDDFYIPARGAEAELTWGYLFEPFAGHVIPAQMLNFWLVGNYAPLRWDVVAAEVVVLQLLATVVMWHVLTRLLPGRWVRVPLLAVFAWTPLTLAPTLWWSAAIALWPHVLCSLLAMLFLLRTDQKAGSWVLNQVMVVGWVAMGLAWHERAVLTVPLLGAFALALSDAPSVWRRVRTAVVRFWLLWALLALGLAGYLVAHGRLADVEGGGGSGRQSARLAWEFVGRNLVPGMASGPWDAEMRGGAVVPAHWVTALSLTLAVLVTVALMWRGGPARWWALLLLGGYVTGDLLMLIFARSGFGSLIALDPRYTSDIPHVAVPALALALRGARPYFGLRVPSWWPREARASWPETRGSAVALLTAAYLAGSAVGTAQLVPHFQNTQDRQYVTTLRAELAADPNQVLFDRFVPAEVVLPLLGEQALLSQVFGILPESPAFDQPSARMRVVDENGRLSEPRLAGSIPSVDGPVEDCGYAVKEDLTRVPFAAGIRGHLLLRTGYFTAEEATVEVRFRQWNTVFLAQPGPNEIWIPLPDMGIEVDEVWMRVLDGPPVCVSWIEAGLPEEP